MFGTKQFIQFFFLVQVANLILAQDVLRKSKDDVKVRKRIKSMLSGVGYILRSTKFGAFNRQWKKIVFTNINGIMHELYTIFSKYYYIQTSSSF
jgi:hypothetical protein